jgi:hypothetical protein
MNDQAWRGLESAALALIFAPEPFTTPLGIALLVFARKMRLEQQEKARQSHPRYSFHDYYNCRLGMVNRSAIAYNVAPIRQGQLPLPHSTISKIYESRREWEAYHRTVNLRTKSTVNIPRPSPQQPTGLLQTPVLRYQSGLRSKTVTLKAKTKVNISCPSPQQPAGMLQTPFLRYQNGLRPKRV